MGIPKFYGRWITSDKYKYVIARALPTTIANLWIDGNGSIHNVAQDHYGYGKGFNAKVAAAMEVADPLQQEYEFDKKFTKYLTDLISKVKPQVGFCLAIDGVAPIGKIAQQQERRNKAVHGLKGAPKKGFDSNCITPGTPFMVLLDRSIQQWILTSRDELPPQLIYSSHMVRGEGEHNIFDHVRNGDVRLDTEGYNVVYGLDADLIILSLLSPARRIMLCREDLGRNVNIDILRDAIVEDLKEGIEAEPETLIRDFAFMTFFVGNDFLRPLFALGDVGENINDLMETYKAIGSTFTDNQGGINWETVWAFIGSFAAIEEELLTRLGGADVAFPFPPLMDAITITTAGGETYTGDIQDVNDPNQQAGRTVTLDYDKFRSNWYRHALGPRDPAVWDLLDTENINPVSEQAIESMCIDYLKTLQWNLLYYMKGEKGIKKDWLYHYRYAPLLKDLQHTCRRLIDSNPQLSALLLAELGPHDTDIIFTFNEQLLAVIPPSSFHLIPERLRQLVVPGGPLCDMCVTDFILDTPHKNEDWETIAVLPFIPVKRIYDTVRAVIKDDTLTVTEATPIIIEMFAKDVKIPIKVGLTKNPGYARQYEPRDDQSSEGVNRETGSYERGRGRGGFDRGRGRGGFDGGRGRGGFDRGRGRGGFDGGRGRGGFDQSRGRGGFDRGRGGSDIPRPTGGLYRPNFGNNPQLMVTRNIPLGGGVTKPSPVNLSIKNPTPISVTTADQHTVPVVPVTLGARSVTVRTGGVTAPGMAVTQISRPIAPGFKPTYAREAGTPYVPKVSTINEATPYVPKVSTIKEGTPYTPVTSASTSTDRVGHGHKHHTGKPHTPAYTTNRRPPTLVKMDLNAETLM
jgi:hypothetical protein